ncbi:hypothetical protein L486_08199 [Kwoniella mangroviensis CBS 10435]|uniref:Uncharacterized protein n=1 Tax=Kwoniella mangroviensis CBS 10435 TaxID=1331196 RepID=A0A1B9IFE4_9TREE|nr:uncharacterized protein I203_07840 [Kwoniella mangroviensis CBS 8507]OCF54285.1 hypothetical protein L486_08199 [Kwoniella mangroviensis CBS 10435]OCF63104.1 hypothetical protein I203_07840 [Kwoniella mangroviensis CBS 8507]OCF74016.1 hypothetical protein I204_05866 [Kwoniella mangroviensis CBS 8886]
MLGKLTSFLSSSEPLPSSHTAPRRADSYVAISKELEKDQVPVSESDCVSCPHPCASSDGNGAGAGSIAEVIYDGKSYEEYVLEKYGDLGELPKGFDMDWETELQGSSKGGKGRVVVISTGKSDWERDHVDEKGSLAHQLDKAISSAPSIPSPPTDKSTNNALSYISPSAFPAPSQPLSHPISTPPSLYSSSLISQSDDPSDQSVLVFPDWKVVHEIDNSLNGAKALYENQLSGELGRAGKKGVDEDDELARRRSWVLPYRAVVLLCSHKRRDKRCHIAAPLLRSALHTVLSKYDIDIDEDGSSLSHLDGPPLEEIEGTDQEREEEVGKRIEGIEGAQGGEGGQVGIFNINHLGGHRYAGVMIILFPSGAYISYGRVTPQEIPRVVEDTILQGKIVPGLLRNAVGVQREINGGKGFLTW